MTFSFDSWFRGLSPRLSYPFRRQGRLLLLACMLPLLWQGVAIAQGSLGEIPPAVQVTLDTLWVVFAAMLVFFMNAGFAMLESGFCRAKNTVNILAKNLIVFALSSLAFWAIGFALMFGDGNAVLGWNGFFSYWGR